MFSFNFPLKSLKKVSPFLFCQFSYSNTAQDWARSSTSGVWTSPVGVVLCAESIFEVDNTGIVHPEVFFVSFVFYVLSYDFLFLQGSPREDGGALFWNRILCEVPAGLRPPRRVRGWRRSQRPSLSPAATTHYSVSRALTVPCRGLLT